MLAMLVHYSGRVQGVGFRYSVKRLSAGYEVVGEVRNLPDGRVELRIGGEKAEMDAFLEAVTASNLRHHIEETHAHVIPADPAWRTFSIAR